MTGILDRLFGAEGKQVVVTGGSRGIGRMIATAFVEAGATVYISARKAEACDEAAAEMSAIEGAGSCVSIPADLSTPAGVGALVAAVTEHTDVLHVLVNNAGATWGAPLDEYPEDAFDKLFNINVKGAFLLTQAFLPALRAAATDDDPARVINIGSIDGIRTPAMETYAYSTTKAGILALTRHLAKNLVRDKVLVNAIAPGPFESKMMAFALGTEEGRDMVAAGVPARRIGQPDDMAAAALFLAGKGSTYLVGETIVVDGGIANVG
ncbi:SDR family oxidoreductase [Actinospongicola halichondriae]|uniref:SDR family oxidoreductase n=1 Tax=Actinospongicola halichondriae TaxID=3236844 RepID=UPI003D39AE10